MRGRALLRTVPFLATMSCGSQGTKAATTDVPLTPTILVPAGLDQEISVFSLQVYAAASTDGGLTLTCAANGQIAGDTSSAASLSLIGATPDEHVSTGLTCAAGSFGCFTNLTIPQSTTTQRIFAVTGYADKAMTIPVGYGCKEAFLTSDAAAFTINLIAIPPTEVCGDGTLQPDETCDPGHKLTTGSSCWKDDPVCGCSCQTAEELLSTGTGDPDSGKGSNTVTGHAGQKSAPSFLWPAAGNFFAFFTDSASGSAQIALRVLGPLLGSTVSSGVEENESLYLPTIPNGKFPPTVTPNHQKQPVAVQTSDGTYVAFADDTNNSSTTGDDFQIRVRSFNAALNALQTNACDVSDSTNGESGSQTAPAMALLGTTAYLAWQDDSGNIYGRTYATDSSGACGTLGTQQVLSSGSSNSHVSVAAFDAVVKEKAVKGFITTWQSGNDIVIRSVSTSGSPATPKSIESPNHSGATPAIASIQSGSLTGSFAVVWTDQAPGSSTNTIYAQLYNSSGVNIGGATQISETDHGGEVSPAVAASTADGGSYVVTWVDAGDDHQVRGRLLRAAPSASAGVQYLTNTLGTTGEFQVSVETGRNRVTPTVAVGGGVAGSTAYIAFGWSDTTSTGNFGITARRFPLPTE